MNATAMDKTERSTHSTAAPIQYTSTMPTPLTHPQPQPRASNATSQAKSRVSFTSGNDFYDDGYSETELNAQIHCKLDFRNTSFFGRSHELRQLNDAFDGIVWRSSKRNSQGRGRHQKEKREGKKSASDNDDRVVPKGPKADSSPGFGSGGSGLPAAFLWGLSGTGKSRLVKQFATSLHYAADGRRAKVKSSGNGGSNVNPGTVNSIKTVEEHPQPKKRAYIIQGKNDENTGSKDPFSAIIQALNDFCRQVADETKAERRRIAKIIRHSMNGEVQTLTTMVPSISFLLNADLPQAEDGGKDNTGPWSAAPTVQPRGSAQSTTSAYSSEEVDEMIRSSDKAWNQLRYVFGSFIKAIATKKRPLVMFLDDLQWSSQVALDLLSTLLQDKGLKSFLFIGAIRQEINPHTDQPLELEATSPLSNMFDRLHASQHQLPTESPQLEQAGSWPRPPEQRETGFWTNIHLGNMTQDDIGSWLSQLLDREVDELRPLTVKLHNRTNGNIFFLLQLLEELERTNAIAYSRISFQWEWHLPDEDSLDSNDLGMSNPKAPRRQKSAFASASNIVQLMVMKLNNQPAELRTALIIASYIRFSFDFDLLMSVLSEESAHQPFVHGFAFAACNGNSGQHAGTRMELTTASIATSKRRSALLDSLEQAVLDGLLSNTVGSQTFRFAHDRIQQAALSLVPFGETRSKLKQRIGMHMWNLYCQQNGLPFASIAESAPIGAAATPTEPPNDEATPTIDTSLLFVAADHLNSVPTKDHLFSMQLNVEVGEQASKIAATAPSAVYLQLAHNAFRKLRNPWGDHFDLSLRLHQLRTDAELTLGRFQLGFDLGHVVLEKAAGINEKIPVYCSMAEAYGRQDKQDLSMKVSRSALLLLGEYPKRAYAVHAVSNLLFLRSYLGRHTDEQILSLPALQEKSKRISARLLIQVWIRALVAQNIPECLLAPTKIARMSIKNGLCAESAFGFVNYGLVAAIRGDQREAERAADLAKKILAKWNDRFVEASVDVISGLSIYGWSRPAALIVERLHQGFSSCMRHGEFLMGFDCWSSCNVFVEWEGYPVSHLHQSYESMFDQMALYKVSSHLSRHEQHARSSAILAGERPLDWLETARYAEGTKITKDNALTVKAGYWGRMHLAIFFQKPEVAKTLFDRLDHRFPVEPVHQFRSTMALYAGMMAAGLYQRTKRLKYKRLLRRMYKTSEQFCNTRGECTRNRCLILRAECLVAKAAGVRTVTRAYDVAIFVSDQIGHVHEVALACERCAEFLIGMGERRGAITYMSRAYAYYSRWGAVAKLDDLKQRRSKYVDRNQAQPVIPVSDGEFDVVVLPSHLHTAHNAIRLDFGGCGHTVMGGSVAVETAAPSGTSSSAGGSGQDGSTEDDNVSVLTDIE